MKWFNKKISIFIIGIICISMPVLFAISQSITQSLNDSKKTILLEAHDVMYRADKTGKQIEDSITRLEAFKGTACSSDHINLMRTLDLSSSNIQAIGYVQNNVLLCSSLGIKFINWNLGPADLMSTNGISVRFAVKFPNSEIFFVVIEKNHYVAIIHKDIVLETALFKKNISLGIFSLGNQRLYTQRGFIDKTWFKRLGHHSQTTFLQDGYLVAIVSSTKYKIATIAAKPFSYFNQNMVNIALLLVPMSALAGLLFASSLIYWMRHQTSPTNLLKNGLKLKQFYLLYQPIFDAKTNRCVGAEALIRWKHPSGEAISPEEFIPLAEKTGLIRPLTDLVLELIGQEAKDLFKTHPHFHLAINVSAEDLYSEDFIDCLKTLMLKTRAGPDNLIIEATERKIMNLDILKKTLHAIHSLGIKVAIDDFGTGYSNLSYLETLELDYLKIDKSFIDAVENNSSTNQIILHIIKIAKALNLQIIAEGIECKEQAVFIRDNGVQFVQGWFYGKPAPLKHVLLLLGDK